MPEKDSKNSKDSKGFSQKRSIIDILILGFAPGVQLDIVARNLSDRLSKHEEFIAGISRELGSLVQDLSVPMAAAYRQNQGLALLLGIPVTEVEKASGRNGLSVTLAVSVNESRSIAPTALVQMLAALDLAIANACEVPYEDPAATALVLTRHLQHNDNDEFRGNLSEMVDCLSHLFSQLLMQSPSRWWAKMRPSRRVNINGTTCNYRGDDVHFSLCDLVTEKLRLTGQSQVAYYSKIGCHNVKPDDVISGYRFVSDGVIICKQINRDSIRSAFLDAI